uniref:Uncharacterized protein n=1 Tax=Caenorhabditis japonica TaxID=281687 RepID=A0A8R1IRA5_CAEJA
MTDVYRTTISTARDKRDAFPGSVGISRRQEPLRETEGRGNTPRGSSQSRLPVASAPTFLIRPPRRRLLTTSRRSPLRLRPEESAHGPELVNQKTQLTNHPSQREK